MKIEYHNDIDFFLKQLEILMNRNEIIQILLNEKHLNVFHRQELKSDPIRQTELIKPLISILRLANRYPSYIVKEDDFSGWIVYKENYNWILLHKMEIGLHKYEIVRKFVFLNLEMCVKELIKQEFYNGYDGIVIVEDLRNCSFRFFLRQILNKLL